ncbi:MAG: hypothetical protein Q7O66_15200 [Dehalococcoidia bacterium]|nr:hypothetical protein [Dehalococcoidia bacterium]
MSVIRKDLLDILQETYALNWMGIHGVRHWARVRHNGLRLARQTGAKTEVVELFAFFHDLGRLNDGRDPLHGARSAGYAEDLAGRAFELKPDDLELLLVACRDHTNGSVVGDVTVLTCWDADRLDLGRVGKKPDPQRLCTAAARDLALLAWAYRRSLR